MQALACEESVQVWTPDPAVGLTSLLPAHANGVEMH